MNTRSRQVGGSKLFELIFVVLLVGVLSMVVLAYMRHYIEVAEKGAMENTVMNLRSGLRLRLAEVLVHNDVAEGVRVIGENPMNWLQGKPVNYAGEFSDPEPGLIAPGQWYYDRKNRELVYLVDHGSEFVPDSEGQKRVRLRVIVPSVMKVPKESREMTVNDVVKGVSLGLAESYKWEFK